jgi:hypothetical protein
MCIDLQLPNDMNVALRNIYNDDKDIHAPHTRATSKFEQVKSWNIIDKQLEGEAWCRRDEVGLAWRRALYTRSTIMYA